MNSNDDTMKTANARSCIPEQPPRIARYLSAWADGTLDTSLAYTEQDVGRGDRVLRGAYYGLVCGQYERGYFKVDTRSGESSLLLPFEVEYGDEAKLFDDAMVACRSFWKPSLESGIPELSSIGISVLDNHGVEIEEYEDIFVTFFDHWFDANVLRELSRQWDLCVFLRP